MEPAPTHAGRAPARLWLGIGAALVVGLLVGGVVGMFATPRAAPQATFTVVAYHWGFAIFDADGQEIPRIEVARGTVVTLHVIGDQALSHELHESFMMRTAMAWMDDPARGNKNMTEIMMEMEDAEAMGLVDHSLTISGYAVSVTTDVDSAAPARLTFTADRTGTFDFQCFQFCGWGHQWMLKTGALVVS